jgi:hypothetical protein
VTILRKIRTSLTRTRRGCVYFTHASKTRRGAALILPAVGEKRYRRLGIRYVAEKSGSSWYFIMGLVTWRTIVPVSKYIYRGDEFKIRSPEWWRNLLLDSVFGIALFWFLADSLHWKEFKRHLPAELIFLSVPFGWRSYHRADCSRCFLDSASYFSDLLFLFSCFRAFGLLW